MLTSEPEIAEAAHPEELPVAVVQGMFTVAVPTPMEAVVASLGRIV